MDLFSDFSFSRPTSSQRHQPFDDMDMEDISPSSSRSTSPTVCSPSEPNFHRVSIAELAAHFDRHTLDRSIPSHRPSPLFGRLQNHSVRRSAASAPAEEYNGVRRRRQSGARNLCSSARLASIETLVDRMLKDGSSCYASLHPSSARQAPRRSEITSAPMLTPTTSGTLSEATSEDDSECEGVEEPTAPSARPSKRLESGLALAGRRGGVGKSRRKPPPARR